MVVRVVTLRGDNESECILLVGLFERTKAVCPAADGEYQVGSSVTPV